MILYNPLISAGNTCNCNWISLLGSWCNPRTRCQDVQWCAFFRIFFDRMHWSFHLPSSKFLPFCFQVFRLPFLHVSWCFAGCDWPTGSSLITKSQDEKAISVQMHVKIAVTAPSDSESTSLLETLVRLEMVCCRIYHLITFFGC